MNPAESAVQGGDDHGGLLIIVTGPPGAGKSTVAELLADSFATSALVPGDQFFGFLRRGAIAPWTAEADAQNHAVTHAAASTAGALAAGGYQVVYDGVIYPELLPTFAEWAGLTQLHYALLLPDEQTCLLRVRDRVGHGFTDLPATSDMHRNFTASDIAHRHLITDTALAPQATAEFIEDMLRSGNLSVPDS